MTRVEQIEKEIESLSQRELDAFRRWFQEFDANAWDEQIEADAASGRLDTSESGAFQHPTQR